MIAFKTWTVAALCCIGTTVFSQTASYSIQTITKDLANFSDWAASELAEGFKSKKLKEFSSPLMRQLPEGITPAQVRCALTTVHRNMYEGNQNFDKDGWLVLGFNGHQPEVADGYTSTGSLYMATLSFLPLGLPADNPFWTDDQPTGLPRRLGKGRKYARTIKWSIDKWFVRNEKNVYRSIDGLSVTIRGIGAEDL